MAFYLNKVFIGGNITADPEIRDAGSSKVCNFTIAINRVWYSGGQGSNGGEKKEDTAFVRITAWNKLAEQLGTYIKKGANLFVEGRLATKKWTDEDGKTRSSLDVIAEKISFISTKGRESSGVDEHVELRDADHSASQEDEANTNNAHETEDTEDLWKNE